MSKTGSKQHKHQGERPDGSRSRNAKAFATFSLIAESRDGKLCLFEDSDGHYTVVRSSRLA